VYKCVQMHTFDERCGAMDMARARMKHNPAKRGLGRVGWLFLAIQLGEGPQARDARRWSTCFYRQ
jgi:hypothetical protein